MGMYDSVWVECPRCGTKNEFQTKSGECRLESYTLINCPDDALADVNRHAPHVCVCGACYAVDIRSRKPVLVNDETTDTIKYRARKFIGGDWVQGDYVYFKESAYHAIRTNGQYEHINHRTLQVMTTDGWADIGDVEVVKKKEMPRKKSPTCITALSEKQISELAAIGMSHIYEDAIGCGRISEGGVLQILQEYEKMKG